MSTLLKSFLFSTITIMAACSEDRNNCIYIDVSDTTTTVSDSELSDSNITTTDSSTETDADTLNDSNPPDDSIVITHNDTSDVQEPLVCDWQLDGGGLIGGLFTAYAYDAFNDIHYAAATSTLFARAADQDWVVIYQFKSSIRALDVLHQQGNNLIISGDFGLFTFDFTTSTMTALALHGLPIRDLDISQTTQQHIYAVIDGAGFLRSQNSGKNWQPLNVGMPRSNYFDVDVDTIDGSLIYTSSADQNDQFGPALTGKVMRSTDAGLHWEVLWQGQGWPGKRAVCDTNPLIQYIALGEAGLLISDDGGQNWFERSGAPADNITNIVISDSCDQLIIASYNEGIYYSNDGGQTLTGPISEPLATVSGGFNPRVFGRSDAFVWAGTDNGLFTSSDEGQSWGREPIGFVVPRFLTASIDDAERLYMGSWGSGFWVREANANWQLVESLPSTHILSAQEVDGRLFVGTWPQAYVADLDLTEFIASDLAKNSYDFVKSNDVYLSATQVGGVYRSNDGVHWIASNNGFTAWDTSAGTFIDVRDLAIDPTVTGRVWAATNGKGLWLSDDDGLNWRKAARNNGEFGDDIVHKVEINSNGYGILSLSGTGLLQKDIDDEIWQPLDISQLTTTEFGNFALLDDGSIIVLDNNIFYRYQQAQWQALGNECQVPITAIKGFSARLIEGELVISIVGGNNDVFDWTVVE